MAKLGEADYFQPMAGAIGSLLVAAIFIGAFLQRRWNVHARPARSFMVGRSAVVERARSAGCFESVRAQVRWRKPGPSSTIWMLSDLCLAKDELIIIPNFPESLLVASPFPLKPMAFTVPRRRLTGASLVPNPVRPSGRYLSRTGDPMMAISTDANCTCYVAFPDARNAVDCACAIQRRLAAHRREHGFAPRVRIGVHAAVARLVPQARAAAHRKGGVTHGSIVVVNTPWRLM